MFISKSIIKEQMKASKEMITCPICEGTVLNHHKQLKFGDTDIREIIKQPLDQVLKTVGDVTGTGKIEIDCWRRYDFDGRCLIAA